MRQSDILVFSQGDGLERAVALEKDPSDQGQCFGMASRTVPSGVCPREGPE